MCHIKQQNKNKSLLASKNEKTVTVAGPRKQKRFLSKTCKSANFFMKNCVSLKNLQICEFFIKTLCFFKKLVFIKNLQICDQKVCVSLKKNCKSASFL